MLITLPEAIRQFEQFLREQLTDTIRNLRNQNAGFLADAVEYAVFTGGKRLRPKLGLALCLDHHWPIHPVLPALAAIELVHCYSLVHDDLPEMDNDYWRRNHPSVHAVFGPATALLVGNGLLTKAFELLSQSQSFEPDVSQILTQQLAKTAGFVGLLGGQFLDLMVSKLNLNSDKLIREWKTGGLFQLSLEWPTIVFRRPTTERQFWSQIGLEIGEFYQLVDDFLDQDRLTQIQEIEQTYNDLVKRIFSQHPNSEHLVTLITQMKKLALP